MGYAEQSLPPADRFGEVPLFYGWTGEGESRAFVFGSELKALRAYPGFATRFAEALSSSLAQFCACVVPRSIYRGVFQTGARLPGHGARGARLRSACSASAPATFMAAWSVQTLVALADVGARRGTKPHHQRGPKASAQLTGALQDAVRLQSLADVPLGAFLSARGGFFADRALMQEQARQSGSGPVKTFTVGFEEAGFDGSPTPAR